MGRGKSSKKDLPVSEDNDERRGTLSCSALPRVMGCEAAIKYQPFDGLLDLDDDTSFRDDGQIIHDLLASADPLLAEVEGATNDHREVAGQMWKRFEDSSQEFFEGEETRWEDLVEKRLWLDHRGRPVLTGRFDRARFNMAGTKVLLPDWKTGYDPPEATDNWQLLGYAILLCNQSLVIQRVRTCIVHRWGCDSMDYDRESIDDAQRILIDALERRQARPLARLTHDPSRSRCRYCPGRAICPVSAWETARVLKEIEDEGEDLSIPVQSLSVPQLASLYDALPRVEDFAKAIKGEIKRRVKAGDEETEAAGFYLAGSGSVRDVVSPGKLQQSLLPEVSAEEFVAKCVSVAIGKAEKLHKERTGLQGKKAKEDFEKRTAGAMGEKPKAPALRRRNPK